MKQKQFSTLSTAEMALTLWAVNKGSYEDVPVKKALAFEAEFLANVRANHADVLQAVNASGDLSADNEKVLAKAMESFKAGYSFN
ncbi:ATP synthase subunit alpha [Chromobacterium violaceum]|nr:ATP synthase subunit alpha [Chromobacterium violaceum]